MLLRSALAEELCQIYLDVTILLAAIDALRITPETNSLGRPVPSTHSGTNTRE